MNVLTLPHSFDGFFHDAGLLLLAWFLGALLGAQREAQGRSAGLRTHALVCGAACLLTLVSEGGAADKGRIAAQIVSGIGFLGAGVILRKGVSVRGLTTAATIWTAAALGIAVGFGGRFALLAAFFTGVVLLTLIPAKLLAKTLQKNAPREAILTVTVGRNKGLVAKILQTLTEAGVYVTNFETETLPTAGADDEKRQLRIDLRFGGGVSQGDVAAALTDVLPPGTSVAWDDEND